MNGQPKIIRYSGRHLTQSIEAKINNKKRYVEKRKNIGINQKQKLKNKTKKPHNILQRTREEYIQEHKQDGIKNEHSLKRQSLVMKMMKF